MLNIQGIAAVFLDGVQERLVVVGEGEPVDGLLVTPLTLIPGSHTGLAAVLFFNRKLIKHFPGAAFQHVMAAEGVRLRQTADKGVVFREVFQHFPGAVIFPEVDGLAAGKLIREAEKRQKLPVVRGERVEQDDENHIVNAGAVLDKMPFREVSVRFI